MSREQYIWAPYYLDPLILLNDDLADRLYGRIDKVGRKTTGDPRVWVFLMRNMYGVLQGEDAGAAGKTRKRNKSPDDILSLSGASIKKWAFAFNTAVKSQVSAESFRYPRKLDKEEPAASWSPPLVLITSPITRRKIERYFKTDFEVTNRILRKMDEFRSDVKSIYDSDPDLQLTAE